MQKTVIPTVKTIFITGVLLLVTVLVAGGSRLERLPLWVDYGLITFSSIGKRVSYEQPSARGLLASIVGAVAGRPPAATSASSRTVADPAAAVPVLMYHRVVKTPDGINPTEDQFLDQMFTLKRNGWQAVSMAEFERFLRGDGDLPERSFVITFDDGAKESFYPVDPVLRALGWRATNFIITAHSVLGPENNYYLSPDELELMERSGRWDIQSHGRRGHDLYPVNEAGDRGYFYTNLLWREDLGRNETIDEFRARIAEDLAAARRDVESAFGVEAAAFAFPFGNFGQYEAPFPEAEEIVTAEAAELYRMAFYQAWGGQEYRANYAGSDDFLVRRIPVLADWGGAKLLQILEQSAGKTLPYEDDFASDRGWLASWGERTLGGNFLAVTSGRSSEQGSGGAAFLDGTAHWADYRFTAILDWLAGTNVLLTARFNDSDNYVACNFGQNRVRIDLHRAGERRTLADIPYRSPFLENGVELGIAADGPRISCLAKGRVVARATVSDPALAKGGVGFRVWGEGEISPEIRVTRVLVEPVDE